MRPMLSLSLLCFCCTNSQCSPSQNEPAIQESPPLQDTLPSAIGVSLGLFASDPLWSYQPLTAEIADIGTQNILLAIPLTQKDYRSNAPVLGVPTDVIRQTIQQADDLQLSITLMPLIILEKRKMSHWRGILSPSDPDLWWRNYNHELKRIAYLASDAQIERLVIGAELCSLEADTARWIQLISTLRNIYRGQLTYSANWDHYQDISFWAVLDEIAVTAYFPVQSVQSIEGDWQQFITEIQGYAQERNKPFIITEYGYPSRSSALKEPWNETTQAEIDPKLQAELIARSTLYLQSTLSTDTTKGLQQAFLWNWFGKGGVNDGGYTLRGKIGQQRFRDALHGIDRTKIR